MLHKSWKYPGKALAEVSGVDLCCDVSNDTGAPAGGVAGWTVGMGCAAPVQNTCPIEEVMNECINRDHAEAGRVPTLSAARRADQQAGKAHREYLV